MKLCHEVVERLGEAIEHPARRTSIASRAVDSRPYEPMLSAPVPELEGTNRHLGRTALGAWCRPRRVTERTARCKPERVRASSR